MAKVYFMHKKLRDVEISSKEQVEQYITEGLIIPLSEIKVSKPVFNLKLSNKNRGI